MVIDSSAIMAIMRREPEGMGFCLAILADAIRLMSAASKLECAMVMMRRTDPGAVRDLDDLLREFGVTIIPFDDRQADIARDAFARFGQGRRRAALNLGDCAAYALAIAEAEPLLFKGTGFAATDVECVELDQSGKD